MSSWPSPDRNIANEEAAHLVAGALEGTSKTSLIEIGKVPLFSAQIKQEYKDAVTFKQYDSRSKAIAQVRKGKYVAAVEQNDDQLVVH